MKNPPDQKRPPPPPPRRAVPTPHGALRQSATEAVNPRRDAQQHEVVTARPPPDRPSPPAPSATAPGRARPSIASSIPAPLDASGVGLNWAFICDVAPVSRAVHFRAIVQLLGALSTLHTDVSKSPIERFYGAVCAANLMVRADGSVLLVRGRDALAAQPSALRAPELARAPAAADQQTDLFAVAGMLLEAILGRPVRPDEVIGLQTIEPHVHACFRQYAADPLLALARRGLSASPSQRWVSARAFADAIVHVGGQRVASTADLQHLVRVTLARQAERLTPVHPTPEALSLPLPLPLPPATPALHTLLSTAREPSYAPPALVEGGDAQHGRSSERPAVFDLERASSATSIEPDGLFAVATPPRPASHRGMRWAAAGLLLLGAAAWGVSKWFESPPDESLIVQTPTFEPVEPAAPALQADPGVRPPQTVTAKAGDVSPAARPALSPTTVPNQAKPDLQPAAPVPTVSAAASPKKGSKPVERSLASPAVPSSRPLPRAPARVSSDYDPEGI